MLGGMRVCRNLENHLQKDPPHSRITFQLSSLQKELFEGFLVQECWKNFVQYLEGLLLNVLARGNEMRHSAVANYEWNTNETQMSVRSGPLLSHSPRCSSI